MQRSEAVLDWLTQQTYSRPSTVKLILINGERYSVELNYVGLLNTKDMTKAKRLFNKVSNALLEV